MTNDLISRSELKKALTSTPYNDYDDLIRTENLIDNAPTVEPFEPDYVGAERVKARQRGYEEGYRNGMEIGRTLNPKIKQGKWRFYEGVITCEKCGKETEEMTPFCAWCGEDKRGEK